MSTGSEPRPRRRRVPDRETDQPRTSPIANSPRLTIEDTPSSGRPTVEDMPLAVGRAGREAIGEPPLLAEQPQRVAPAGSPIDGILMCYFALAAAQDDRMDVKYRVRSSAGFAVGTFHVRIALRGNRVHFLGYLAALARARAGVAPTDTVRLVCEVHDE